MYLRLFLGMHRLECFFVVVFFKIFFLAAYLIELTKTLTLIIF